jgi:oligoribonuclease NrnB/cAMP/cGMP phosphodiesterase (DHH superfamily)
MTHNSLDGVGTSWKNIVYYHFPCQDGIAGAWCAFVTLKNEPVNTDYFGLNPAKYINVESYQHNHENTILYFIDVLPTRDIITLCQYVKKVVILDHHKTNLEYINSLPMIANLEVVFDIEKAGAQIAWDYFNPSTIRPWFIDYIADRDLWTWKLPDSRAINSGLQNKGHLDSIEELDTFYKAIQHTNPKIIMNQIANYGYAIASYQKRLIDTAVRHAIYLKFSDDTTGIQTYCWAGTITQDMVSDLGSVLSEQELLDGTMPMFAVIYTYYPLDNEYLLSLRSSTKEHGIDVSRIAKSIDPYGGGHKNAAGCKLSNDTFWKYFSKG